MDLLNPNFGLLIWTLLAFLVVFYILAKFAWPAIIKGLKEREQSIAEGRVLVATDEAGRAIGTACVMQDGDAAELGLMFVDPPAIGGGIGRALFDEATKLARRLGYRRMTILADVNAASFYERMGARFLHDAPSDAIPGRTLPFYEYDLAQEAS